MNKKLVWVAPKYININPNLESYFNEATKKEYSPYVIKHGVGIKVQCKDPSHNDFYTGAEVHYKSKSNIKYKSWEDLGDMVWIEIITQDESAVGGLFA